MYEEMCGLYDNGQDLDIVRLVSALNKRQEGTGWASFVAQLVDSQCMERNLDEYVDTLLAYSRARQVQTLARRWAVYAGENPTMDSANGLIADLKHLQSGRCIAITPEQLKETHDAWVASGGEKPVLRTGIGPLDAMVRCQADHLWIIGARPKTGKTSLAVDLFARFAETGQGSGLFYSLEMAADRILRKFHHRVVPHQEYIERVGESRYRPVTIGDLLAEHSETLYSLPLKIVDNEHTVEGICASARHEIAQDPTIKYIAIDYVEMMTTANRSIQGSVEVINHALRSLVALKKELRIPIILISQLRRRGHDNRRGESMNDEPSMDEFKGSGLIEQSADVMLMLWEPAKTQAESLICGENYRKLALKIVQRDGANGVIDLQAYMPQSRFRTWRHGGMDAGD